MDNFDLKDLKPEDVVISGESPLVEDKVEEPSQEEVSQEEIQEEAQETPTETEANEEEIKLETEEEPLEEPTSEPAQETPEQKIEIPKEIQELSDLVQEDEYIKNALEYYKKNRTLEPYLNALNVDYNEMSAEKLLRLKHERENPDLDPKIRQRLFEKEVLSKYKLDDDLYEDEELEIANALLERDANRVRKELIEEQQNFIPKNIPQPPSEEEVQAQIEEAKSQVQSNLKDYLSSKSIQIDTEEPFNYGIKDTNKLVDYAVDNQSFFQEFYTEDNQVDWNKWAKTVAFMQDPDSFVDAMINHGKSLGKKSFEEELKNPDEISKSRETKNDDLGNTPYDNKKGFLEFALKNKK